jgi:hypothetical protein
VERKIDMEWINVLDKLPSEYESVIAFGLLYGDTKKSVGECFYAQGEWTPVRRTVISDVTHWMPLPEEPISPHPSPDKSDQLIAP